MTPPTWIFGYGSLASPASIASTIGRDPRPAVRVAHVAGFGRRWNYGSMVLRGDWTHDGVDVVGGQIVSLGVEAAVAESCNGLAFRIDDDELALLDWRERDYERVDVSSITTFEDDAPFTDRVEIYVPRPSAIERYEQARDAGRAAVRSSYWQLVRDAFATLGDVHAAQYDGTPPPDVPIVDVTLHPLR